MQELLNYDFLVQPISNSPIRASQDKLASFQRDFSSEINQPPRFPTAPNNIQAAGKPVQGLADGSINRSSFDQIQPLQFSQESPYGLQSSFNGQSIPLINQPRSNSVKQITPRATNIVTNITDYEQQYKVRQLELSLLDFKGAMERKFTELSTDLPTKLSREIRALEIREQQLAKDVAERLVQIQESDIRHRDQLRNKQAEIQEQIQKFEVKNTESDYKLNAVIKQLEMHTMMFDRFSSQLPAGPSSSQGKLVSDFESQTGFLREQLNQLQRKNEQTAADSHRQQQYFQEQLLRIEQDMVARLKEQRDSNMQILQIAEEAKSKDVGQSQQNAEEANQMIRQVLSQIERKQEEDLFQRQAEQKEISNQVESKLLSLVEKLKQDERLSLERERRLMEQVQEGLQTMNEIIKGTKEHGQVALTQQTQVLGEKLGSHNQNLEEIKSFVFSRQDIIEVEVSDAKQRLIELEQATLKHVTNVNNVVETELKRFENVITALEKQQLALNEDLRGQVTTFKQDNTKWRVDYEDITTKKIQEIHQALKMFNQVVKACKEEIKDVKDGFQSEMRIVEQNLGVKIGSIKLDQNSEQANIDEHISMAMLRQQDKLKQMVDLALADLTNKFNDNLAVIETKFKQNNTQIKQYVENKSQSTIQQVQEQNTKEDTILEGRCQQFTVAAENRLLQKVNQLFGKFDGLKDMVQKLKTTPNQPTTQIQLNKDDDVALLRDQGERENALKDWCLSQMKVNYNDFDKLLTAKYLELKTMIETTKLQVLQSIPEPPVINIPDMRQYAKANQVAQLEDQLARQEQTLDELRSNDRAQSRLTKVTPTHNVSSNIGQDQPSHHLSKNQSQMLIKDASSPNLLRDQSSPSIQQHNKSEILKNPQHNKSENLRNQSAGRHLNQSQQHYEDDQAFDEYEQE